MICGPKALVYVCGRPQFPVLRMYKCYVLFSSEAG